MNNQPYPIYVISLKRCPERRLHVQRQLDTLGLSYRFVDGVDKYDLKSTEYLAEIAHRLGIDKNVIAPGDCFAHNNTVCTLSHIKAHNLMVEQEDAIACILEDDVVLSPDFPKILCAAQKTTWDILMLSSLSRIIISTLASDLTIQETIKKYSEIDCSLFPRLRREKWFKRLLPPRAVSQSQLDWTSVNKLEWFLLMLLSHPTNRRSTYSITERYKRLVRIYNPKHPILVKTISCIQLYTACKVGGLPIRSSQQPLYRGYDIAIPVDTVTSGMAYLLTLEMAHLFKEAIHSGEVTKGRNGIVIDYIPSYLQKKYGIKLRIITPPCVTASLVYLVNSVHTKWG